MPENGEHRLIHLNHNWTIRGPGGGYYIGDWPTKERLF